MKVVLIGAGNVAHHLGSLISKSGHEITQIVNRSRPGGIKLAKILKTEFTNSIRDIDESADIYILALKDDVIAEFCTRLPFSPKLIVHTSGTCSIDVFPSTFNCGVIYPVQTFSKSIKRIPTKIPFCIEARKKSSLDTIRKFVRTLSDTCYVKTSAERERIHLAAVFVNNFTNHLFTLSENYLAAEHLSFDILRPLIMETALKVQNELPSEVQTGPARRGDKTVLREHFRLLEKHPEMKKIYGLLTKSIIIHNPDK